MSEKETSPPLTLSAGGSPVRTSLSLAEGLASSQNHEVDFGLSTPESFARFDPASSSWRTSQHSLLEGSTLYSESWPRAGMMRNGTVCRRQPSAPLTDATDSFSWPTPRASDGKSAGPGTKDATLIRRGNSGFGWNLAEAVQVKARNLYPTPQARDWKDGLNPKPHGRHSESLPIVIAGQEPNGGALNPTWVEWLMGFPSGWTDLEPSGTL